MSELDRTSEKTDGRVLPQPCPLESAAADNPRVGTKRAADSRRKPGTGIQHGRGEIGDGLTCPPRRHPSKADNSAETETGGLTAPAVAVPKSVSGRVFVLDRHGKPLMPCHPARARNLLGSGRAVVAAHTPLVIRLKDKDVSECQANGVEVGIDPGSVSTGMAVFRTDASGVRHGLVAVQVDHRGRQISKNLSSRAILRRGRRSRNLRYRSPRFSNRHPAQCASCGRNAVHGRDRCRPCQSLGAKRQDGLRPARLAPSLAHRVDADMHMLNRLHRWSPLTAIHLELVRFDTHALQDPEISGVDYQRGSLAGYEVREHLLIKHGHRCAYCGVSGVPLNLDHVRPRSRGGSNRVSNLVVACICCNQAKGSRPVEDFLAAEPVRLARVLAQLKAPLRDAAAMNSTRWELWRRLQATGLAVSIGTGGRTKWNRSRHFLPKSHALDALCVGDVGGVAAFPGWVIVASVTGRGSYQRVNPDKFGFPRAHKSRRKQMFGFATGDLVRAAVPKGKKAGVHVGRVAIRSNGSFNIKTSAGLVQGIHYRHCHVLQRANGWSWVAQPEGTLDAA